MVLTYNDIEWPMFKVILITSSVGFLFTLAIGSYFKHFAKNYEEKFEFPLATNTADIPTDWTTLPFVSMLVTEEDECPRGSDPVFERPWYGLELGCDCTREDRDWGFIAGRACRPKSKESDCETVEPWPAMRQIVRYSENHLICGIRGGKSFLDLQRVTDNNGNCPERTIPCIANQETIENIICYPTSGDYETDCPITDLLIVDKSKLESYTAQGYTSVTIVEDTAYVVYSKKVDKMPPTTIRVGFAPCMN